MSTDHEAAIRRLSKLEEYASDWLAAVRPCMVSFDRFVALMSKPRPADPGWRRRVKNEMATYEAAGETAQAVPPPAEAEAFHQQVGEMIEAFIAYEDHHFAALLTGSKRQAAKAEAERVRALELLAQVQSQASMLRAGIRKVEETR